MSVPEEKLRELMRGSRSAGASMPTPAPAPGAEEITMGLPPSQRWVARKAQ
jgi:hypothetical protein